MLVVDDSCGGLSVVEGFSDVISAAAGCNNKLLVFYDSRVRLSVVEYCIDRLLVLEDCRNRFSVLDGCCVGLISVTIPLSLKL
jgi:hypothetical protein